MVWIFNSMPDCSDFFNVLEFGLRSLLGDYYRPVYTLLVKNSLNRLSFVSLMEKIKTELANVRKLLQFFAVWQKFRFHYIELQDNCVKKEFQ